MKRTVITTGTCFLTFLLLVGCGLVAGRQESKKDASTLRINGLGPTRREQVSFALTTQPPPNIWTGDIFHYALLQGTPVDNKYGSFRISRSQDKETWYLVLESSVGKGDWIEEGKMYADDHTRQRHFILERVDGGEGAIEKNIRDFQWRTDEPGRFTITITIYRKLFFNPFWGTPEVIRFECVQN